MKRLRSGNGAESEAAAQDGFGRGRQGMIDGPARTGRELREEDFGGGPQAVRIVNALAYAGVRTVPELLAKSDSEILKMKRMGKGGLKRIEAFRSGLAAAAGGMIAVRDDGSIFTTLSREQLLTALRVAKLELDELRDHVSPEKVKAISDLLGMIVLPELDGKG